MESAPKKLYLNSWLKSPDPVEVSAEQKTDILVVQLTEQPLDPSKYHKLHIQPQPPFILPVFVEITVYSDEATVCPHGVGLAIASDKSESRRIEFRVISPIAYNPEIHIDIAFLNSGNTDRPCRIRKYDSCFRPPVGAVGPLSRWKKGL